MMRCIIRRCLVWLRLLVRVRSLNGQGWNMLHCSDPRMPNCTCFRGLTLQSIIPNPLRVVLQ